MDGVHFYMSTIDKAIFPSKPYCLLLLSTLMLLLGFVSMAHGVPLYRDLPSYLHLETGSHPIFGVNASYHNVANNMFGNDRAITGEHSSSWYESVTTLGWAGAMITDKATDRTKDRDAGRLFGSLTGISINSSGYDAVLSNIGHRTVNTSAINTAYLGWQSGDLDDFESISYRISAGRQNFHIGNGLVLWTGGENGGKRGDLWTGARTAWSMTGLFSANIKGTELQLFYLSPDDYNPDTRTELAGLNLDLYRQGPYWLGATVFNVFNSDTKSRDGLSVYNLRLGYNQNDKPGFSFMAEYLIEDFDDSSHQTAWYTQFFWLSDTALDLKLGYRYASFDTGYDILWFGGEWYQGAYTGNFLLINQNLQSHQASVSLTASEKVTLSAQAYFFEANKLNAEQFSTPVTSMTSKDLATELNVNADWQINNHWNLLFTAAWATPHKGMTQWVGGDQDVIYFMVNTQFNF